MSSIDLDHPEWQVATTFATEHPRPRRSGFQAWRKWLRSRRPVIVALLSAVITVGVVGSLAFGSNYLATNTVDQQSQASVLGTATLDWPEQNLSLPAGQVTRLKLTANPGAAVIDGIQAVVSISGTNLPPMQFIPNAGVAGLEVAGSNLVPVGTGQQLQIALISQYTELGFNATGQSISLGELVFTPSAGVQVKLSFDGEQTAIIDHGTGLNMVGTLVNPSYAFQEVPASPVASPIASVTPSPSLSPSPTVTPSPTLVPSPVPSPTPSPSPTPELMVVNKAVQTKYPFGLYRVDLSVSDSLAPNVKLTATGFGNLNYNKRTKRYTGTWYGTKGPFSTVTIVSSTGKEVVAPLQQKVVRFKLYR